MKEQSGPGLALASSRTGLLMGLGVLVKLVVDIVIIARFGLTGATDAFFVAYTLLILAESLIYPACQSGLVPIFIGVHTRGGPAQMWAVFNSVLTLGSIGALLLATGMVLGSPVLTKMLAPGLGPDNGALAARMAAVMLTGLVFVVPIGVMRAFLNANNLFAAPATIELIRGSTVIGVVVISLFATGSYQIEVVAVGFALAAFVQACVLGGVIGLRLGGNYRMMIDLDLLRSVRVERMLTVPLLDNLVSQSVLIVERIVGSFLPAGSITALSYGHRLASVIGNTLFTGVEVVSLSALATSLAGRSSGRQREAQATLMAAVRLVVVLGMPVGLAVWALKLPLIQFIFEREGGPINVEAALVLGIYAATIPLYGYLLVARSYLFASGAPQLVLLASGAQLAGVAITAPLLAHQFGAAGVAVAYAIGQALACSVGALVLGGIAGPQPVAGLAILMGKVLAASGMMAGTMVVCYGLIAGWLPSVGVTSGLVQLMALAGAGVAGGVCLLGMMLALRVEELLALNKSIGGLTRRWHMTMQRRNGVEPEV
ncbi:MAG: lipid II flippase MurJ [Oscillochloridaceae bacterium]|nr:hypothetical protein [Chloroflexaceae bacterium]MDW8391890.1 lipid II flippase MurJ [Oscillochloridaceae bacterium]